MAESSREESSLEKMYADKIRKIWKEDVGIVSFFSKKRTITGKLEKSQKIIESVDKIKWPDFKELGEERNKNIQAIARNKLKMHLYDVLEGILNEFSEDHKLAIQLVKEALE